MPIAKSHGLPNKKDRKPKAAKSPKGYTCRSKDYEEVEAIVDLVYVDICNGVSKYDILRKLEEGNYGKAIKHKDSCYDYYNAAESRLAINADIEAEKLRNVLYSRYEAILEECIKKGDMYNARATLDSIAKIFLGADKPVNAIQINSDKENGVTINFGFGDKENEN